LLDDMAVVHDLVAHIDRGAVSLQRPLDDLDSAVYPGAKAARGCQQQGQGVLGHGASGHWVVPPLALLPEPGNRDFCIVYPLFGRGCWASALCRIAALGYSRSAPRGSWTGSHRRGAGVGGV